MKQLWVEKYRPDTVDGYVFVDDSQREQVQSWIKDGTIPHLLLSGAAGTGKTTLAKVLINELGIDQYDVMYVNGSKEGRKIEWVDKLISFVQTMPFGKFKVVLIDEADYMNKESVQPALRNLMEDYSSTVRFIMTCNYPHKIIDPIHSRCQGFHITKTDHTEFTARVATVLVTEGVEFDLDSLDSYVRATYPDLRKCLNLLARLLIKFSSSTDNKSLHFANFSRLLQNVWSLIFGLRTPLFLLVVSSEDWIYPSSSKISTNLFNSVLLQDSTNSLGSMSISVVNSGIIFCFIV
jgi:DNA polymerase III delta prime subunit